MAVRSKTLTFLAGVFLSLICIPDLECQQQTELDRLRQEVNAAAGQQKWDRAIDAADKLREVTEREFGKNSKENADVLESLAVLHKNAGYREDAVIFYELMIDTLETLPGRGGQRTFAAMDRLGVLYRGMRRLDAAEAIQKRELEFGRRFLPADPDLAYAYNGLGILYLTLGRYAEAEPLLRTALDIRRAAQRPDQELIAISEDNLGQSLSAMNRFPEAEEHFLKALPLFREVVGEAEEDTIFCMENLAVLYSHTGRTAKGIELLTTGLGSVVRIHGQNHPNAGTVLGYRGHLYLADRHFSEAEADFLRALTIAESRGAGSALDAKLLLALSEVYAGVNDYSKADAALERAQAIEERSLGPENEALAPIYRWRGRAKLQLFDLGAAKNFLQKALDIDTRVHGPNDLSVAQDMHNLAQAYIVAGGLAEAEPLVTRAIAINEKLHPDGVDLAENYNELGSLLERLDHPAQAEAAYRHSVDMYTRLIGADQPKTLNARTNLGLLLINTGKSDEALGIAQAREKAFERNLLDLLASGTEQQRILYVRSQNPFAFLGSLGVVEPLAEAVFNYKGVVTDSVLEERAALGSTASPEQRKAMEKWQEARRNLTKWSMEDSTGRETTAGTKAERASDPSSPASPQAQGDKLAAALAEATAELQHQRMEVLPGDTAFKLKVADIRERIPGGAALLDFVRYSHYLGKAKLEDRYGAIVLASTGQPKWVPLGTAWTIEQAVAIYDGTIRGVDPVNKIRNADRVLYDLLIAPVLSALPPDTTRLLISPDGELNFVSFSALLTPDDGFLAEQYSITYLANARQLLRTANRPPVKQMRVYANPQYRIRANSSARTEAMPFDDRFQYPVLEPLPFTSTEAESLRRIAEQNGWRMTLRAGREATENDLRSADKPGILHLATHGFYLRAKGTEMVSSPEPDRGIGGVRPVAPAVQGQARPGASQRPQRPAENYPAGYITSAAVITGKDVALDDPMLRSGVALAGAQDTLEDWRNGKIPSLDNDGILNAEEAAMLDLHGVWLVTLSSCDSGRGEAEPGEGIFGLRRGFLRAGAQNVLTTLWPVNDSVTAQLMSAFYRKALVTGDAPAALAEVQRDALIRLRKEHGLDAAVRLAGAFVITSQGTTAH